MPSRLNLRMIAVRLLLLLAVAAIAVPPVVLTGTAQAVAQDQVPQVGVQPVVAVIIVARRLALPPCAAAEIIGAEAGRGERVHDQLLKARSRSTGMMGKIIPFERSANIAMPSTSISSP